MKDIASKIALLAVSLVASCLLGEGLVRAVSDPPWQQPISPVFTEHDPLLGWKKIPRMTGTRVTSEYTTSETTNSRGIRGPEYSYDKRPGDYRILVLGDSFAEGYSVEFDDLVSEVLKRRLNERHRGRDHEVVNLGTRGYSTDQEMLAFETKGARYAPDLTVLLFHDNDVLDNTAGAFKPVFRLDGDGGLVLTNVPVPVPTPRTDPPPARFRDDPGRAIRSWLYTRSSLYRLVRDQIMGLPVPTQFMVYRKQHPPEVDAAWKVTEALLVRLNADVSARGGKLLVFYVPIRASVYPDEWEQMKKRYRMSSGEWDIEQVRLDLLAVCRRRHLDCLDPVEDFKAEVKRRRPNGSRLYFKIDGHWTADGHHFAGEMLARYIGERYVSERGDKRTER